MKKAFSKSLSWLLSVVMIFGMLVVSNVSLTTNAYSYNASAAVDYARQYWNNYNPAYTNYNSVGGDCANFVSQCLYAGGLEQDDRWYNGSAAWINCASQIAYFRDMGFTVIDYAQASDIQIGNPVYYYNGNSMAHTAICVGYSSDGTPLVAAHNKNHWEYEWTLGGASWWGGSTRRVTILMPGHNNFPGDIDYSYAVPVSLVADHQCDTYNSAGNKEYGHYISSGDNCYIETVYTNGFCYVKYDLDGGGTRWAYAWAGDFNIPKKETKVDIGTDFYAYIINTSAWKMVVDVDYNVQLQSENAYRNQIWYFERKDDLYYKITNVKTGYCLDVNNAGNTNGTNIAIWENNDSDAQRWCFTEHEGKYVLHPKCAVNMALDVNGASTDDGANIQLWETNGTSAQDFTIWKFDNTPNKPTVTSDKNVYTTGSNVRVYWGENAFATSYWVDVWHNNEHTESFETNNIEYTINNSQSGDYTVYVRSLNSNGRSELSNPYTFYVCADVGTDFYAYIINTSAWKMATVVDDNVQLQSETGKSNQIWYFERQGDCSYKISNVDTKNCLDVNSSESNNSTNVLAFRSTENDNQRWYLTLKDGNYVLHPKHAINMSLDVNGGSSDDGTNIQIWETNGTSAQDFTIWKFDNTPNKPTVTSDRGMYPTGSDVKIYWGENAFATSYIVDVWYNNGISGEHIDHFNTTNIECTINNCQSGKYGVFVTSVNTNGNVISDVYNFFVSKDIGNEFYASIIRNDDWLSLQDIDGNAVVSSGSPSLNEVWYFTKADNECGYFIKNCKTEKYLDLDVSKDENGHNVKTWDYNGSNAQIWYVLGQSSGTYALKPKCTQNRVLDIDRDSSNAQIWDLEYNNNQKLAIWIYDTFEVIYNLNGGTEVIENQTKVNAHDLAITDVKPTRVDYEFLGWSRDNNATIAEYLPGATFSENANTTLYAVWRELKLENISTLSAETIKLGESVTVNSKATGGTAPYQYNILYKQTAQTKWTTVQSYKANATVTFKPANATTYDVCVKVKDSNGTEVKKYFTVKVTDVLKNNSTLSKTEITLGDTITVNGKATGGSGSYQYNILYKQTAQSKWTTVQSYKANATVTIKPTKATTYDVCVKVKDGNSTEVKEYFTVNVTNNELKNISTLSAETIILGENITVSAKATGSTGFYTYAVYYKKTSDTKWTTVQDFKANNKITVEPKQATTYDICVKVKDDKGTIDKKYFTINVTSNELKNISTVSAETINIGESVTVNANATGSTGFYTYAIYYKQEAQTKWTTVQDFKANNKVTVKPTKATTYDICVKVKDDQGTIDKKYFKVNVTDFANTSELSTTEIKLGNTIEVSCMATGSTGFYQYAVYYKKTADTKWIMEQNYSPNNTVTIKPTEATTYDICVKVKDNQDNIVKRYFEVIVK